ncbi:MAG: AMP-binding protein, partial [Oscillospiraceae bacterium]|nr:AMP-binding protein [Oscillospiraceae bacterium]
MKISFSTLGCPDFDWADVYSMAKDLGFDGIELRVYGTPVDPYRSRPFTGAQLEKTVKKLQSLHLEIPCISSNCCLNERENEAQNRAELKACMELAQALGAPYIRVLGDRYAEVTGTVDDAYVAEMLKSLIPEAEAHDVTLLVETNGVYSNTMRLAELLDKVDNIHVAAVWDMHHPYRYGGESAGDTVAHLGNYIKFVQTKDSSFKDGKLRYEMMGKGDLPLDEMMRALESIGYTGFVSLEWVKRWMPELSDAAVVFPGYADYMAKYRTKYKHDVQVSRRGTGFYPWPKERLIDYTFPDVLDRICEQFPNQYAFRYTELDYTRTYPQFRDDVDTFARALIAMGVGVGDKVAIWATNVPQWYLTFWATTKIGAVLVTFNTGNKIHETEYVLKQSDTNTLVMIDSFKGTDYNAIMRELVPELATSEPGKLHSEKFPFLKNVITIESKQPGCYTWEEAVAKHTEVPLTEVERRRRAINKDDVANMQYTSGTTGFPKGVMLTHYNVVNNGKAIGDCMDLSTEDRMMIQVPMFHCFGMVLSMTSSMTHGTTMSPMPYFSAKASLACINQEKITCFNGVPT